MHRQSHRQRSCFFQAGLCQCLSNKNLSRIQRIQNTLARVVTFSRSRSSTALLLKHLHWLPVSARIHIKIALLTFKSLHAIAQAFIFVVPMFLRVLSALLVHTCQHCIRLVWVQIGRPYHLEFLTALSYVMLHYPYLQETTQDTLVCFSLPLQLNCPRCASDSMISIYLFIYLVVLDFVRA